MQQGSTDNDAVEHVAGADWGHGRWGRARPAPAHGWVVAGHRFLNHRGFRAPAWLKATFLMLGSMALEGPAITWASTHLEHHAHSDKEGDPHSPLDGLFHAHVGWLIDGFKHNVDKYGYWLLEDRMVVFFSRTFLSWTVMTFLIGGWSGLLWRAGARLPGPPRDLERQIGLPRLRLAAFH